MSERYMDVKEVATYLKLNVQTIYRKVKLGQLPCVRAGGAIRFKMEDVDKWVKSGKMKVRK